MDKCLVESRRRVPAERLRGLTIQSLISSLVKGRHSEIRLLTAADRLDDHRVQIQTDVDKQLGEIHAEHINQVESLSTQFEEQLSILHRAEEPLHSPLAAEMIRIETVKAGGEHDHKYIDVKLEERVVEFQKLVKEKHLAISKLIDEWNETQVEIIALAAEILGPEKVAIKKDKKHKEHFDFDVVFKQSKITHDRSEKDFEGVLNEISGLEQKATELTETTKQTMRKQQQVRHAAACLLFPTNLIRNGLSSSKDT